MSEMELEGLATKTKAIGEKAAAWIASADVKSTAILATAGAILAIVLATPIKSTAETALMTLYCVGTIFSIVASALAILPRTDRLSILRKANCVDPLDRSPSFFSDLGQLGFSDFARLVSEADEVMIRRDTIEQAYVSVVIARQKMYLMRVAVIALSCALAFLVMAILSASGTALFAKEDRAVASGVVNHIGNVDADIVQLSSKGEAEAARPLQEDAGMQSRSQHTLDGGSLASVDAGDNESAPHHR